MRLRKSKYGSNEKFWGCSGYPDCQHLISCHPGTTDPMGIPADPETRKWRHKAHQFFDQLWRPPFAKMSRPKAYRLLQRIMGMSQDQAHIGNFNKDQCKNLIRKLKKMGLQKGSVQT
jgi:ssDNA-binding Zn-finger/Zn-ribbon topoisomerase 1